MKAELIHKTEGGEGQEETRESNTVRFSIVLL